MQRLAQIPDCGVEDASVAIVRLVFLRRTSHFAAESIECSDRFDNIAAACGWSSAGHDKPSGIQTTFLGELSLSLGHTHGVVKC